MRTIQTRIDDLEKRVNELTTKDLEYVFFSKTESDGSVFYKVDRGSGKEWITKEEFHRFEEENYKDNSKKIIILDRRIFGGKSSIEDF
jgi:hypothetical protein